MMVIYVGSKDEEVMLKLHGDIINTVNKHNYLHILVV